MYIYIYVYTHICTHILLMYVCTNTLCVCLQLDRLKICCFQIHRICSCCFTNYMCMYSMYVMFMYSMYMYIIHTNIFVVCTVSFQNVMFVLRPRPWHFEL